MFQCVHDNQSPHHVAKIEVKSRYANMTFTPPLPASLIHANGARATMHSQSPTRVARQPPAFAVLRRAMSQLSTRVGAQLPPPTRAAPQPPRHAPPLFVGSCAKARL